MRRRDALHRVRARAIKLSPALAWPARHGPEYDHPQESKAPRGRERVDSTRDRMLDHVQPPDPAGVLLAVDSRSRGRRNLSEPAVSCPEDIDHTQQGRMWVAAQWRFSPPARALPEAGRRRLWQSRSGWQRRHRAGDDNFPPTGACRFWRQSTAR